MAFCSKFSVKLALLSDIYNTHPVTFQITSCPSRLPYWVSYGLHCSQQPLRVVNSYKQPAPQWMLSAYERSVTMTIVFSSCIFIDNRRFHISHLNAYSRYNRPRSLQNSWCGFQGPESFVTLYWKEEGKDSWPCRPGMWMGSQNHYQCTQTVLEVRLWKDMKVLHLGHSVKLAYLV